MLRMFRGPEGVERRRDMMRGLSLDGGSTEDSRELLTSNPTSFNLVSPGSFPCQKNVYSCSLRLPFDRASSSLLKCSDVNVEPFELAVNDGGFPGVINLT